MRSWYVGNFKDGLLSDIGLVRWLDGSLYYGEFENGQPHGLGIETYANGSYYEGEMAKGKRDGIGTLYGKGVHEAYCGEWMKGSRHGSGFTGKFSSSLLPDQTEDVDWVIKGHTKFDFYVETSCGRVTQKTARIEAGYQSRLMTLLDKRYSSFLNLPLLSIYLSLSFALALFSFSFSFSAPVSSSLFAALPLHSNPPIFIHPPLTADTTSPHKPPT